MINEDPWPIAGILFLFNVITMFTNLLIGKYGWLYFKPLADKPDSAKGRVCTFLCDVPLA